MKTSIPSEQAHPFAEFVRILGKGKKGSRSLTESEAHTAMTMILNTEVLDVQLGAFLMLLRVKEESVEELLGFVRAAREALAASTGLRVALDWSSYAGKRRHLPWYLFSIFLLAQKGHRILAHGASGHTTDRIYSEDVLQALGIPVAQDWASCEVHLEQQNFAYFPLSALCPPLHAIMDLRTVLGLRSPVHTLARLLNPADAPCVIQGIFHPGYRPVHQQVAQALGYQRVDVIKGEAGEIERNPDSDCLVQSVRDGELLEETWPALFQRRHVKEESLALEQFIAVWRGDVPHEYGEAAVTGTLAIALKLLGDASTQEEAMALASALWQERDRQRF